MKAIFGLGNPDKSYDKTRHNAGFMSLNNYIDEKEFKKKDNYLIAEKFINGEKVLFVKPLTYMNNSVEAAGKGLETKEHCATMWWWEI